MVASGPFIHSAHAQERWFRIEKLSACINLQLSVFVINNELSLGVTRQLACVVYHSPGLACEKQDLQSII